MSKVVALIPLRGGSKGIPQKNIKLLGGKPLCYWSIKAAVDSGIFDEIVVSTEDNEIKNTVLQFQFPKVSILDRPRNLAEDKTSTEAVIAHFSEHIDYDILFTIQATSPLTTPDDFRKAFLQFNQDAADSLVTGVITKRFFWNKTGIALNYNPAHRPRRQDFDGSIMENGAFYITTRKLWKKTQVRLGGKISIYAMSDENEIELDDLSDWEKLETILLKTSRLPSKKIRMVILDVDGVLTDGGMIYSDTGDELKKFNTRDGKAIQLLRESGIKTAIITAENIKLVQRRAEKLNVDHVVLGSTDKLRDARLLCEREDIRLSECAFIGDDIQDIELLEKVGMPACPNDANYKIAALPCIIRLHTNGGAGVVREFVDNYICLSST